MRPATALSPTTNIGFGASRGRLNSDLLDDFILPLPNETLVCLSNGASPPTIASLPGGGVFELVTDLNGDGVDELLRQQAPGLAIYSDPSGNWSSPSVQPEVLPANSSGRLAVARLVTGGHAVLVQGGFHLAEARFDPAGTLVSTATYPASSGGIVVGDVDGDGDDDVIYGGSFGPGPVATLLRQDASGTFAPEALDDVQTLGRLVDIDADGDLDLVGSTSAVSGYRNDGFGGIAENFAAPFDQTIGGEGHFFDIDSDGDVDLVGSRSVWYSVTSKSGPARPAVEPYRLGGFYRQLPRTDREGDGDGDLIPLAGGDIGRNLGSVTFVRARTEVAGDPGLPGLGDDGISRWHAGDWDGDGDLDWLLARAFASDAFLEFHGPGFGSVGLYEWHDMSAGSSLSQLHPMLAVDIDNDGDVDAIETSLRQPIECSFPPVTCSDSGLALTRVYLNDGMQNFAPIGSGDDYTTTDVVDLDGDGLDDFVIVGDFGLGAGWARNLGSGIFDVPTYFGTEGHHPMRIRLGVADLDFDGDVDIAVPETSGSRLFLNDGIGNFTPVSTLPPLGTTVTGTTSGFETGDYNGDGLTDLMLSPSTSDRGTSLILVGDGAGGFAAHSSYADLSSTVAVDFDRDGDRDRILSVYSPAPWIDDYTVAFDAGAFDSVRGGEVEQAGRRAPGSGGVVPVLGLAGQARAGNAVELRIRHGLGGAPAILALSAFSVEFVDFPVVGITLYVNPFASSTIVLSGLSLSGSGVGRGSLDLPLTLPTALAGLQIFAQALILDAGGAGGLSSTNALRVKIGS